MIRQTPELLIYQDDKLSFHEEPLSSYLEFHKLEDRFLSYAPENERGYIGIWKIIDNQLHLVDLKGFNQNMKVVSMEDIFLATDSIFAGWYTGEINLLLKNRSNQGQKKWIKRRVIFQDGMLIDQLDRER